MTRRALAVLLAGACLGCRGDDSRPLALDLDAGTYGGIGLGSSSADIQARFGEGESAPDGPAAPLGEEFSEIGGALSIPLPSKGRVDSRDILRYDDVAFLLADDRTYALVVTAGGPIGEDLDNAARFGSVRCGETSGGEYREYPYCVGELSAGRFVWFGEDPIRSITVSETSLLRGT